MDRIRGSGLALPQQKLNRRLRRFDITKIDKYEDPLRRVACLSGFFRFYIASFLRLHGLQDFAIRATGWRNDFPAERIVNSSRPRG